MREKIVFENCCCSLKSVRTGCVEKPKNVLSGFSGCRMVFEICSYEIEERFPTGLVNFGAVFI